MKKYTNEEITVVWKPKTCSHSERCWRGLGDVFQPRSKPWINMAGADTQAIINQVDKCPSGALSWHFNNDAMNEKSPEATDESISEENETIIEVAPNGPLMVYGTQRIKLTDGSERTSHKVTAFCRCGQSSNKPYCDGTHKKVGFEG